MSGGVQTTPVTPARPGLGRTLSDVLLSGRYPLVAVGAAVLAGAVFVAHALQFWSMTVDDAAISFTYARNLVAGDGLVLQPGGERVEAYSNLLWVLLLAGGHALGAELSPLAKTLGLLFGVACLGIVAVLPSRLGDRRPALPDMAAPLALAGNTAFAVWSVAGLENSMFALLVLMSFGALAHEVRTPSPQPWSALVLTLLAITRPEGVAYAGVAVVWRAVRWSRDRFRRYRTGTELRWLALLLVGLGAPLLFRQGYFGYPHSNAYYIKHLTWPFSAAHLLDPGSSGWRYVTGYLRAYGLVPLTLLIPASLLHRKTWDLHALGILLLSAGLFFPVYVQGDWMPEWRFMSLITPLLLLLAGQGLWAGIDELRQRAPARRGAAITLALAACGLLLFVLLAVRKPVERTPALDAERFTDFERIRERALYFGEIAAQAEVAMPTLLDPDLGGTSFSGAVEVVDLFGLGDLSLSRHRWRPTLVREYVFGERKPTFIHLHGAWFGAYHLHEYPEVTDRYVRLANRSPLGRRVEGRNWIRKDVLAAPWRPAPREQSVQWDDGVVRLVGVDGGPDAVAPGGELRLDTIFTVSRPTVWNFEGAVLTLPPAAPIRGDWINAPAVLVSRDYRPYDRDSGELVLAFRCPGKPRRPPRLYVRLSEPEGGGVWEVDGDFVAPPALWRRGAECLWRGTVVAPKGSYDLDLEWWSGRGAPWRRRLEGMDTRVDPPTPLKFAFGLYPSSRWSPGERVVGRARLPVPAAAAEGRRRVMLALRQTLAGGERGAGAEFVTAGSGTAYVEIGEVEVGHAVTDAAFRRLEGRVAAALTSGRLGAAGHALQALKRFDDRRGRVEVSRAAQAYGGALLSRAIQLRESGDLATAATVTLEAARVANELPGTARVRTRLATDLEALGRRARLAGDADGAFEAFQSALALAPQRPAARRMLEELRPEKLRHYDPARVEDAWAAAEALTRLPSEERLDNALISLVAAGLHREAAALCPWSACGMERGPTGRLALARAHRALGHLVEAASLLDPGRDGPGGVQARLLRHDVLALLGRQVPPSEVADAAANAPHGKRTPLGPWATLVGHEARRSDDGATELTFYLTRAGRAAQGQRKATVEATGAAGSRRVRRIVRLSPAPLIAVPIRLRLPTGLYQVTFSLDGHGSAVLEGVSVEGANWSFEAPGWEGWRTEGEAFGPAPVEGPVAGQQDVTGWRGLRMANSYHGGDASRGKLISAPFVLERPTLEFLLGGGRQIGRAEVRLVVGGRVLRRATGRQSERLRRVRWSVSELFGETATIEVIDDATGPWGHILFDDLRLTDARASP